MDRRALSRATEGTDAPTPGYLYVDLQRTVSSNPTAAKDTATWLINRLQHKNHNVKYKCLNLISKLAAVPYFQRSITVDSGAIAVIKEHMNFRGPPDPLRGDEIYSRVRTICKECLDALYREPEPVNNNSGSSMGINNNGNGNGNTFGGISSESYRQGSYNSHASSGGNRMQGFGSHPDPRTQGGSGNPELSVKSMKNFASNLGEAVVGMIKDPLAKNAGAAPQNNHIGSYRPNSYSNSSSSSYGNTGASTSWNNPPGRTELAAATAGQWTMASNRGSNAVRPPPTMGGWGSSANNTSAPTMNTNGLHSEKIQQPHVSTQSSVQSDGSYERSIIADLCPASGLYAVPDDGKLANFRGIVSGLNVDFVSPPLLDLLESDLWQVKGKALHVINVLTSLGGELGQSYQEFFYECRAEIEPLAQHNKHAVRDPAAKVLKKLGVVPTSSASQKPAGLTAAVEVEENLLELDSPDKVPRPAAVAVSSQAGNDLFGGLTEKQSSGAAENETQQDQQKQENSLLETPSTTDIFSEMTLTDAPKKAEPEAAPASGFSFMNSSAQSAPAISDGTQTAAPPVPSPPEQETPVKTEDSKSFDPLLSLAAPGTVPSAVPAMTINPTAAYQVNPQMQMQMQMHPQMMAMQQQQQQQQAMYRMQPGMPMQPGRPVMLHGQGVGNYFNLDVPQQQKEDKSFDFVKDVVKSAK